MKSKNNFLNKLNTFFFIAAVVFANFDRAHSSGDPTTYNSYGSYDYGTGSYDTENLDGSTDANSPKEITADFISKLTKPLVLKAGQFFKITKSIRSRFPIILSGRASLEIEDDVEIDAKLNVAADGSTLDVGDSIFVNTIDVSNHTVEIRVKSHKHPIMRGNGKFIGSGKVKISPKTIITNASDKPIFDIKSSSSEFTGTLENNGIILSINQDISKTTVIANQDAVIKGNQGYMNQLDLKSNSILSPGNSPGVLITNSVNITDNPRLEFVFGQYDGTLETSEFLVTTAISSPLLNTSIPLTINIKLDNGSNVIPANSLNDKIQTIWRGINNDAILYFDGNPIQVPDINGLKIVQSLNVSSNQLELIFSNSEIINPTLNYVMRPVYEKEVFFDRGAELTIPIDHTFQSRIHVHSNHTGTIDAQTNKVAFSDEIVQDTTEATFVLKGSDGSSFTFQKSSPNLIGHLEIDNTNVVVEPNVSLGTADLIFKGEKPVLSLNGGEFPNTLNLTKMPSNTPLYIHLKGDTSTKQTGPILGDHHIMIAGMEADKTPTFTLENNNATNFTGDLTVSDIHFIQNANLPNSSLIANSESIIDGGGTVKNLTLNDQASLHITNASDTFTVTDQLVTNTNHSLAFSLGNTSKTETPNIELSHVVVNGTALIDPTTSLEINFDANSAVIPANAAQNVTKDLIKFSADSDAILTLDEVALSIPKADGLSIIKQASQEGVQALIWLNNSIDPSLIRSTKLASNQILLKNNQTLTLSREKIFNSTIVLETGAQAAISSGYTTTFNNNVDVDQTATLTLRQSGTNTNYIFNTTNPNLKGTLIVDNSKITAASSGSFGTSTLKFQGRFPTLQTGDHTLINTFDLTDGTIMNAVSHLIEDGKTTTLNGPLKGSRNLQFISSTGSGTSKVILNDHPDGNYAGTLYTKNIDFTMNAKYPNASLVAEQNSILRGGDGVFKNLTLQDNAQINLNDPTKTLKISGDLTTSSASQIYFTIGNVSTNPTTPNIQVSNITVTGNANLDPATKFHFDLAETSSTIPANTLNSTQFPLLRASNIQDGTESQYNLQAETIGGLTVYKTITNNTLYVVVSNTQDLVNTPGVGEEVGVLTLPAGPEETLIFQNTGSDPTQGFDTDAFRFTSLKLQNTTSSKINYENLFNALAAQGPISVEKNETRLWVSPFLTIGRQSITSSDTGSTSWTGGSLVGVERRNRKNTWTIGLLSGGFYGNSTDSSNEKKHTQSKSFILGVYNTLKYGESGFTHELLAARTFNFANSVRNGFTKNSNEYNAKGNYRSTTDKGNAQFNYIFDLIKDSATVRLDTGITYLDQKDGEYTEKDAPTVDGKNYNNFVSSSSMRSWEWYSGIGLRKIWKVNALTIRSTLVYEYGYELTKNETPRSFSKVSSTLASSPISGAVTPRQNKHYLQFNTSYLDKETGIKLVAFYSGTYYKNAKNHTFMLKAEYRF